jgi:hypothetical protein
MTDLERWNSLMESITEEEARWIVDWEEHRDLIAKQLLELDDFVIRRMDDGSLPGGCVEMLESLLLRMRNR